MRILFCSPAPLVRELGSSKIFIELAEEMEHLGWACTLLGPEELAERARRLGETGTSYAARLRAFLKAHAADYDVVEYEHSYLPFPRGEFCERTLLVARAVLLGHHFYALRIPSHLGLLWRVRRLLVRPWERAASLQRFLRAHQTVQQADLVNVANQRDRAELLRWGVPAAKILVLPFGLSRALRVLFEQVSVDPPLQPTVAFVGTFDDRKGAADFPAILERIALEVPGVRFRLLGTAGIYTTAPQVLARLPRGARARTEVHPRFLAEQLPSLLQGCSVGMFPSYLESFGFGVLEMLAAAIPVVAYDVPGPSEMLPPRFLAPPGDAAGMAEKIVGLLRSPAELAAARQWARQRSRDFCWEDIARRTSEAYVHAWAARRGACPTGPRAVGPTHV